MKQKSILRSLRILTVFMIFGLICQSDESFATFLNRKNQKQPKLLLVLVIDQFRADYLTRFHSRFLPAQSKTGEVGGFEFLMSKGAYFPQGQYDLMQSITAPGHATVLTGAYPYQAGIPLNEWYNRDLKKIIHSVYDDNAPVVESSGSKSTEVQPGSSPKNLISTTIGDELKNAGFPSHVVSVSLKDRSAILLGGHRADLATWFDSQSKQWVSSKYYLPNHDLPAWLKKLNQELALSAGKVSTWELKGKGTGFSDQNAMPLTDTANAGGYGGKAFPHSAIFGSKESLGTPLGLELTETAAERAVEAYQLGKNRTTDVLAISFSTHDIAGHAFGPNSREMEEITVAEDRAISKLLNFIKKKVPGGLDDTLIVFTADHGVAPTPEWASAHRLEAGRIDGNQLTQSLCGHLNEVFGEPKQGNWISAQLNFNFYLNLPEIRSKKLDPGKIEAAAKQYLAADPRLAYIFTSSDYKNRTLPYGMHERQILHSYFPGRSGEIVAIPKPLYIHSGPTASHMTGYSYDRTVPILFVGRNIQAGVFATRAEVVDIAPTLAFLLGVIPPNLSEGRVLAEILAH